jgi:hypothetical protein
MKTTFAPTLKHAQTNGYMSIWTRVGCRLGIVGTNFLFKTKGFQETRDCQSIAGFLFFNQTKGKI